MTYPLEDIRSFIVKRPWLYGDFKGALFTDAEYAAIKARTLVLTDPLRVLYLRAFIDGWTRAKD
jgi:hypothetical protein